MSTVTFMATNGGAHAPATWAQATVDHIVTLDKGADPENARIAEALKADLRSLLEGIYTQLLEAEKQLLADDIERLVAPLEADGAFIKEAAEKLMSLLSRSVFAEHFKQPRVQQYLLSMLSQHFATALDVERSWHSDANQEHDVAQAYQKARSKHGMKRIAETVDLYRNEKKGGKPSQATNTNQN